MYKILIILILLCNTCFAHGLDLCEDETIFPGSNYNLQLIEDHVDTIVLSEGQLGTTRIFFFKGNRYITYRIMESDLVWLADNEGTFIQWDDHICHRIVRFKQVIISQEYMKVPDEGKDWNNWWWNQNRVANDLTMPKEKQ